MAIKDLQRISTDDDDLDDIQSNLQKYLQQFPVNILSGSIVETMKDATGKDVPLVIGTSTTMVAHMLGRPYQGFFILDQTSNSNVWRDSSVVTTTPGNSKSLFLPLIASSAVTVKIWVF